MGEKVVKAKKIWKIRKYECDSDVCDGEMVFVNGSTVKGGYLHECDSCEYKDRLIKMYPHKFYEIVEVFE